MHFSGVEDSDVTGFNSEFRFLEKVFPHLKQVKSVRIKPAPSKGSNMGAQAMNLKSSSSNVGGGGGHGGASNVGPGSMIGSPGSAR